MTLPERTKQKKILEQHNRCFYCAALLSEVKVEIEHIIPRSKSRTSAVNNLCLSCFECNRQKASKSLEEFKQLLLRTAPHKLIRGQFYFEFINIYPRG